MIDFIPLAITLAALPVAMALGRIADELEKIRKHLQGK